MQSLRPSVLIAYTETLRDVYIIGVPCGIIAFFAALVIKNSKMPTKEEEQAAMAKLKAAAAAKEKEAALAAGGESNADSTTPGTPVDAEKAEGVPDAPGAVASREVTAVEQEEEREEEEHDEEAAAEATGLATSAGFVPEAVVESGDDAPAYPTTAPAPRSPSAATLTLGPAISTASLSHPHGYSQSKIWEDQ